MTEVDEPDPLAHAGLLDGEEFDEAFQVFSEEPDKSEMSTANSVLLPFLSSIGLRVDNTHPLVVEIKKASENNHRNMIRKKPLLDIIQLHVPALAPDNSWPSQDDVLKAFRVFDVEGVGFIKVTLLKRFLVQAQLDVDETVLERLIRYNCTIDGDDLINYEEFVQNISEKCAGKS